MLTNHWFVFLGAHQLAAISYTSGTVRVCTETEIFQHLHVRNIETHSSLFCDVIAFFVLRNLTPIVMFQGNELEVTFKSTINMRTFFYYSLSL